MKFIIDIIALVISGFALQYSHRSNKISKESLKGILYKRRKEIYDACIECLQNLKVLMSENETWKVSRGVSKGESFRGFLNKIDGFENFFKLEVKEWIGELRDSAYAYVTLITTDKNDERLGEKLGCNPVTDLNTTWVQEQDIESVKRMFSKYMVMTDSLQCNSFERPCHPILNLEFIF